MTVLTNDSASVTFPCPGCGKHDIKRKGHDRLVCAKYTCPGCGFEGPN